VLAQLARVFEQYGKSVAAVMRVPDSDISRYGVCRAEQIAPRTFRVDELVEKPSIADAPSNLAVVKEYVLTPDIFDLLESTAVGQGGEIWLTDAVNQQAARGDLLAYEFEGHRYDTGNKLEYMLANVDVALSRPDLAHGLREHLRRLNLDET
jgi:UTP--glucose-1-phosphate uridylyltransferase